MPIRLVNKDTGAAIGSITNEQFAELGEFLEEEGPGDQDFWINPEVIQFMEDEGADAALVKLLKGVCTSEDGIEIEWSEA